MVSGVDVNIIGADNMRIVEDAFTYRLVWALEAIRTRRISLGWSPDIVAGGAAATLETGVPQFLMAMLIRAGLPCAAMNAIREGSASFFTPADMRDWLSSNEIAALTDLGDCPPKWPACGGAFATTSSAAGPKPGASLRGSGCSTFPTAPPGRRQASTASKRIPMIPTRLGSRYPITGASRRLRYPSAT
jgi:hypothetical protein